MAEQPDSVEPDRPVVVEVDPQEAVVLRDGHLRTWLFWTLVLAGLLVFLYLIREILAPFIAGMAVAYFFDPVVDWLERHGIKRVLGTALVMLVFVMVFVAGLVFLVPLVATQVGQFIQDVPQYFDLLRDRLMAVLGHASAVTGIDLRARLNDALSASAQGAAVDVSDVLTGLLASGLAIANILSLLLITPLVGFFLLLEWDRILQRIDTLLPRRHAPTLRDLGHRIDGVLSGFLRGQAAVCGLMAVYYATVLSLSGLNYGLIVGMLAGFLTFIPYVGALTGLLLTLGLALVQFDTVTQAAIPVGLFLLGQTLEGNLITPRLVGRQVGLHDLWVIFAVLAGGALFGPLGVLVAVPVAGCVGVLVRFFVARYLASRYYRGGP